MNSTGLALPGEIRAAYPTSPAWAMHRHGAWTLAPHPVRERKNASIADGTEAAA